MSKGIKPIWWIALVGIGVLAWWSNQLDKTDAGIELKQPATAQSASNSATVAANAGTTSTAQDDWLGELKRDTVGPAESDPFHSAKPQGRTPATAPAPPPPPPVDMPPPTPVEAVLPFQYMGKMERNGSLDIYLDLQGSPLVAHIGETLPDGWRLDRLDNAGLTFIHLATQRRQVLPIGATP
ncbi:hypothetical protein ACUHMQ_03560 [Chitinimonas sp. PSY-7]|uniref:hypothetical protein n=1 Tax=Chitinimonas sp. PSY-7 TaxID=3459088 RepID=UPI00403FCCF5